MKELKIIEKALIKAAKTVNPGRWKPEDYIGGGQSSLIYLNIRIPRLRKIYNEQFIFNELTPVQQWKLWDYVWMNSNYFEVMQCACYFVNSRPVEEIVKNRTKLMKWVNRVDNWAHSDELSGIYSKILEYDYLGTISYFEKWNDSNKPWLKRQSMVGLLFYSRFRSKYPKLKLILNYVDKHINDKHYYVQKAVGWTLRECWNVYPKETYKYLTDNAAIIPSGGWTAATEKLSKTDKEKLKTIRTRK